MSENYLISKRQFNRRRDSKGEQNGLHQVVPSLSTLTFAVIFVSATKGPEDSKSCRMTEHAARSSNGGVDLNGEPGGKGLMRMVWFNRVASQEGFEKAAGRTADPQVSHSVEKHPSGSELPVAQAKVIRGL